MLGVICVVLLGWYAMFRFRRRNMYRLASLIPGHEKEMPGIGIAHMLIGTTEEIMASLKSFSYTAINLKGMMRGWLGHILYFVLTDPKDVEVVLKTCMEKDDLHRFVRKVIGNGGIFAPVSIWRRRRKILVPAFSPKVLDNFVEVFSEQSETLAKRLSSCADGRQFSIWPYLSSCTLDSVCENAMGVKINAQSDQEPMFLQSMSKVLNLVCERIFHLWLQADSMYKLFFHKYKLHQQCIKSMHDFTNDVITKKRASLKLEEETRKEADNNYLYDLGIYQRKTFLDLLISISSAGVKGYTDEELREEVLTLIIAGTDTSAIAIGNTLKLMAKYPEIQEKVYKELSEVLEDSERPITKGDLPKLQYLDRVVKESMRLFPPVPFVIRKVLEDTKLPSGRILPAGCGVVIAIWGIHRDPNSWGADAESFDPDRFLPERLDLPNTCCYMPFSSGPRNCVGYQYATMSVKTALAAVLRSYKVIGEPEKGPVPSMRVKLDIMMKDADGYQVALLKRLPSRP